MYSKKELVDFSDEKIVDLILQTGNAEYFEEIYDRYALKVYQKCLSFTKNEQEAKDVAHDVIVKIYLKLSTFKQKSKFSTWIYSITYNYCVDHQAKKKRLLSLAEEIHKEESSPFDSSPSDAELLRINIEMLYQLMKQLTPGERSILLMKYQDGFSIKEISEITKCGQSAVKMKLKRTKSKLMNLYEQGK